MPLGVIVGSVTPVKPLTEITAVRVAMLACLLFLGSIPASVALRGITAAVGLVPGAVTRDGSLIVSVRREDSAAVSGATVRVFWVDENRYYLAGSVTSDGRGDATFDHLPSGAAWVLVDAPGFARHSTAIVVAARRELDVVLLPGHSLAIRVEDERHAPIPGATVLVTGHDALPFGALSDSTGSASVRGLGAGPWKLKVAARGYGIESRSVASDVTVVLRQASTLDVFVADERGRGVPGATVFVAGPSLWPARQLASGPDGHAKIAGLEPGAYDLKAQQGSRVSPTEMGVRVEQGSPRTTTLALEPGRMIPVVVTDGDGDHPVVVPDADVWLVEGGVSSFPLQGRSNRFGSVTLGPIARGPAVVSARADGFIARDTVAVPEGAATEVRIALLRGAVVRGDVVDADGRPVEGATIEIIGTDLDGMPITATPLFDEFQRAHFAWSLPGPSPLLPSGDLGVMLGAIPPIPTSDQGDDATSAAAPEPWTTGADGTFRASPVSPGRVRALVHHPSYVETTSDVVTLSAGTTATVHVVLRDGGSIEGTLVDEYGVPVAGARVEVSALEGPGSRATTTADDGTFAFATLPTEVSLTVARPDEPFRAVIRKGLTIPDGKKLELELELPAPREPLEVSLEDESGNPVKMAEVTALSLDAERPLRVSAFSDDAGRAQIADAVGLPVRIQVEAPGFARAVRQLAHAPAKLVVDLVSGVLVEGHVTAVRGRRDVAGATVELLSDGRRRRTVTDAAGTYRFTDVIPGAAHLTVSHPDFAITDADVRIAPTGRADRAFDVDAIDLADPGAVEGRVIDADGRSVAGARVGVGAVDAVVPIGFHSAREVVSAADGSFHLDRLRPGKIDLAAVAGTAVGRTTAIVVDSGRTTDDIVIRLVASRSVESAATGGVAVTLAAESGGHIVISSVAPSSEAERAGVSSGDELEGIDGEAPASLVDAERRLPGPEGSDVILSVARGGTKISLRVRREQVRH